MNRTEVVHDIRGLSHAIGWTLLKSDCDTLRAAADMLEVPTMPLAQVEQVVAEAVADERERIRAALLTRRCRHPLVGGYIEWHTVAEVCGPQPAKSEEKTHG